MNEQNSSDQQFSMKISTIEKLALGGSLNKILFERIYPVLTGSALIAERHSYDELAEIIRVVGAMLYRLNRLASMPYFYADSQGALKLHHQDITPILKKCVEEARYETENVEFVEEYAQDFPGLLVNSSLFREAILALIENAVLFNKNSKNKKVVVRTKRVRKDSEDFVVVEVEDNGPGIEEDMNEMIFVPLYSTYPQQVLSHEILPELGRYNFGHSHHIGLGLHIARWCLAIHDGFLDFKSEKGKGSTFFIRIPVGQEDLRQQLGLV